MLPSATVSTEAVAPERSDFIREIVAADVRAGRVREVVTRFPPEPNGHLHIGHAKSIALNFGIAREFGGHCNLRFDDTNPLKEEQEYIDGIQADIRWLGFDWGDNLFYASDYFETLYQWAVSLIERNKAYVDDQTADEVRETRGTLTAGGTDSPYRDRTVEENLDLFARMRAGEFPDGTRVLRAKIDMASPNPNLRDPVLYRILHATHPRTGDAWCIYPTYDFAHGQSDAIEGVTHSICTLEFEVHRPLYDWLVEHLPVPSTPHQYEFARLNLTYVVMSKRFLLRLVQGGMVRGWDDPRMPTISGMRRRGYPAEGIRNFATEVGVAKDNSVHEYAMLEHSIRDVLNRTAPRRFGVIDPVKVVIENWPEGIVRDDDRRQQPGGPVGRDARGRVRAGAVDRARGLRRGPAAQVLPAGAGARGSAAERLLRHLHRRGQGRRRASRRAPLHLRPGHPRRGLARRAAAEGDPPLGLGGARRPCGGPPVRAPVHAPRPWRRRPRPVRGPEPGLRADRPRRWWSRRSRTRGPATRSSSSGWATSPSTRTRPPARWCSTGRSA